MKKKGAAVLLSLGTGFAGAATGAAAVFKQLNKSIDKKDKRIEKFKSYFDILNQWMIYKHEGRNLCEYFEKKGYKKIAIYGVGELGSRLYEELKGTDIEVAYGIDKRNISWSDDTATKIVEPHMIDEPVDVIVVTPVFDYDAIEEQLMDVVDYPVISLEDVVYEM